MSFFKIYDLSTLLGKQASFYDSLRDRVSAALASAKSENKTTVHLLFTDESSSGGLTVQQKLDALGTEAAGILTKVHAVQTMLTTLDPVYVPVTATSSGYAVTLNLDGTATASVIITP